MTTTKLLTILFGLTISISSFGQQLTYKGDLVDTLKIISNSSRYHFDTCGTTTGIYDEFILVFNKEKNNYIINPYQRTEYKFTYKPKTSFKKEKILKQGIDVDGLLVSSLLEQFEINYRKPSFGNIGITIKEFLKLTDKKHIIQVAKWHDADWYLKKTYFLKEKNEKILKGCQNIDTLNMYLETAFDTSGYIVVTDVKDVFNVIISTTKTNYRFEGKYPNIYRQPWYCHSGRNVLNSTSILNFTINTALVRILPDNFSRLKTLKFEALTNEYIEWYLKRHGIIF
jgi:hypothetical protein